MFDKIVLATGDHRPPGPSRVDYHEHRAPTDESVKLLREMEAAAQAKMDAAIRLVDNSFEAVAHAYLEAETTDTVVRIHFMLSGHRKIVTYRHKDRDTREDAAAGIVKAISDEIAQTILRNFGGAIATALLGRY